MTIPAHDMQRAQVWNWPVPEDAIHRIPSCVLNIKTPYCHHIISASRLPRLSISLVGLLDHPSRSAHQQSTRTSGRTPQPLRPDLYSVAPYLIQYRLPPPNDPASPDPDRPANRPCSNSICRMAPIETRAFIYRSRWSRTAAPNSARCLSVCLSVADMTTFSPELDAFSRQTCRPPIVELYAHKFSRTSKRKRPKLAPQAMKVTMDLRISLEAVPCWYGRTASTAWMCLLILL